MAKKVVSITLHKKKPIKHGTRKKKLRTIFKKILNYMKSDTYMFSPLIYPQSSVPFSAASLGGEVLREPIKQTEKKLVQEVEDYLRCDCYMYASLVMDSAVESAGPPTGKVKTGIHCHQVERRTGQITRSGGDTLNTFAVIEQDESYTPTRRILIKHTLAQQEKVQHLVHQNCHPSSVPGKSVPTEGALENCCGMNSSSIIDPVYLG